MNNCDMCGLAIPAENCLGHPIVKITEEIRPDPPTTRVYVGWLVKNDASGPVLAFNLSFEGTELKNSSMIRCFNPEKILFIEEIEHAK